MAHSLTTDISQGYASLRKNEHKRAQKEANSPDLPPQISLDSLACCFDTTNVDDSLHGTVWIIVKACRAAKRQIGCSGALVSQPSTFQAMSLPGHPRSRHQSLLPSTTPRHPCGAPPTPRDETCGTDPARPTQRRQPSAANSAPPTQRRQLCAANSARPTLRGGVQTLLQASGSDGMSR